MPLKFNVKRSLRLAVTIRCPCCPYWAEKNDPCVINSDKTSNVLYSTIRTGRNNAIKVKDDGWNEGNKGRHLQRERKKVMKVEVRKGSRIDLTADMSSHALEEIDVNKN